MTELTVFKDFAAGALQPGWSVTEQATAVAIGESDGSVGSATLAVDRTATSEFAGGVAVEIDHPDAGVWSGKIAKVRTDGLTAKLDAVGNSRALVSTVTAKPFMAGTPIFEWTTPGLLGRHLTADSSGTVVVYHQRPPNLTRWSSDGQYQGVVAPNGGGNGQAGSSLITGGRGVVIDPTGAYVYFWRDSGPNYIQKVALYSGSYVTGFATIGVGDGQVSGSGANNGLLAVLSNGNLVVGDSGNNRVQILSPTGAFVTKWGTLGVGAGQFTTLSSIDVDVNDNVWTLEASGRIQQFTAAGAFVSTFTVTTTNVNAFAVNAAGTEFFLTASSPGRVAKWSGGVLVSTWPETTGTSGINYVAGNLYYFTVDHIGRSTEITRTRSAFTLEDAFTYLAVLYDPNILEIDYQATINPEVVLQGWTGDIWSRIKDLCTAYAVEWSVVGGVFTVRDVGATSLTLNNNTRVALDAISQGGSRNLAIKYQNTAAGDDLTMYTANAIHTIALLETRLEILQTTAHPLTLNPPTPTDATTATAGTYHVQDSAGLDVPAATWTYYGGAVTPSLGETPGQIRVTFQGPRGIIPGYTAPFSLASGTGNERTPQLIITGRGVTIDPKTIIVGTGADPEQAATTIGATIDNFAISTIEQAYSRGSWAQTLATGTDTTITFSMDVSGLAGFGLDVGSLIPHNSSLYRVTDISYGNVSASITARRHVTNADVKTALPSGSWTNAQVNALWAGYTNADVKVKPLRTA